MNLNIDKSNWKKVKLNDVCEWYQKNIPNEIQFELGIKYYVTATHIDSDSIKFNRYNLLSDGQKGPTITKHFQKGDLLLSTRSVELRKAALAPIDGVTGEKLLVIRLKADSELTKDLMPFVFQSIDFWEFAQNSASGSVNKFTSWTKIREYEFLLPPKEEQAKLAELLWAMDEVIERELDLEIKLKIARDTFFEKLINETDGSKVPLSKVLIPKNGKSQVPHNRERYIGLEHIESGEYTTQNFESSEGVKAQCNIVDKGDLCYSKLRPYLDKAIIASFDAVSTTELLVYNTKMVSKEYVLYYLHSRPFLNYIIGQGFGTKMPRVSHSIISSFEILVPAKEEVFFAKMDEFVKILNSIKLKILSSKSLQKSIINQVF
jgi:type I restriction enzyme S subunit